jgi:hypothetical protein
MAELGCWTRAAAISRRCSSGTLSIRVRATPASSRPIPKTSSAGVALSNLLLKVRRTRSIPISIMISSAGETRPLVERYPYCRRLVSHFSLHPGRRRGIAATERTTDRTIPMHTSSACETRPSTNRYPALGRLVSLSPCIQSVVVA